MRGRSIWQESRISLRSSGLRLLAPVEREHGGVGRQPRERLVDHAARHAGGLSLTAEGGEEGREIAAALGGVGGQGEHGQRKDCKHA
jgi:hypothetical protein